MSRTLLFRCFLLLCLSVTFLPGASGCGGGSNDGGNNTPDVECYNDSDCPSSEVCENNFCMLGPDCTTDADCNDGQACVSAECVDAGPAPGTEGGFCGGSENIQCVGTWETSWGAERAFVCDLSDYGSSTNICPANLSGTCIRPGGACTREYNPVAGCDGKCYGNDCMRRVSGAALDPNNSNGACPDLPVLGGNGTLND
ncbi:MAG: hypothetical protein VX834_09555 [Myxococcota bacterium]|nr:hypothetical protein [Myxococcota bacterium]